MLIVDSQTHLWPSATPSRPWPEHETNPLDRPCYLPDEHISSMDQLGVSLSVIVPPRWAGDDNDIYLDWCEEYPGRYGVMGRFDLRTQPEQRLYTWRERPGMLGIRLSYPKALGDSWLMVDTYPWFWAAMERLGIPVMVLAQGQQVRHLAPIATRHPRRVRLSWGDAA